jgi:tartrate-resistant acid phosphatase type 5
MSLDASKTPALRTYRRVLWGSGLLLIILLLISCNPAPSPPTPILTGTSLPEIAPSPIPSPTLTRQASTNQVRETQIQVSPTATQTDTPLPLAVQFAVIGDYGSGSAAEGEVAGLVTGWQPELIITTGDNNYPNGESQTIDDHIGQFYHEFIAPYQGRYGQGAQENRFFPSLGNHDWNTPGAQPYLEYFSLPGNERYYDFVWGPVHFFALNSDSREPDGVGRNSQQANWLQSRLSASTSPWQIIYFHHAPYSSGTHGPVDWMRWPFAEWGADLVFAGHDHTYERIHREGILYIVNGLGGSTIYEFLGLMEGSQVRYNGDFGAMLVEADEQVVTLKFINRHHEVIDTYRLTR